MVYGPVVTLPLPLTESVNDTYMESDSNTSSNLSSLDDEMELSSGNKVISKLDNDVEARLDKEVKSVSYANAIRVIKNWEMT